MQKQTWDGKTERRTCLIESDNLEKLKSIVDDLPDLSKLLVATTDDGKAMYKVTTAMGSEVTALGECLISEQLIGAMRLTMHEGESIETHYHKEQEEWIFVIRGSFVTTIRGKERVVRERECVHYPSGADHYGTVLKDLDCLCVSIPRAEGYPDGQQ